MPSAAGGPIIMISDGSAPTELAGHRAHGHFPSARRMGLSWAFRSEPPVAANAQQRVPNAASSCRQILARCPIRCMLPRAHRMSPPSSQWGWLQWAGPARWPVQKTLPRCLSAVIRMSLAKTTGRPMADGRGGMVQRPSLNTSQRSGESRSNGACLPQKRRMSEPGSRPNKSTSVTKSPAGRKGSACGRCLTSCQQLPSPQGSAQRKAKTRDPLAKPRSLFSSLRTRFNFSTMAKMAMPGFEWAITSRTMQFASGVSKPCWQACISGRRSGRPATMRFRKRLAFSMARPSLNQPR